jgi:uncharacterized membrane protein
MKTENVLLMQQAREALKGKWDIAAGGGFLYMLISVVAGSLDEYWSIVTLLVNGPMLIGLSVFSLALARKQEASIQQIFVGFGDFLRSVFAYVLVCIFVFLWALLLIIPGIIAALAYSQTFYIIAENKSINAYDAMKKSKEMMKGNKKKLFYLGLRFFGWFLLGILTAGIGFLWILPYFQVTMAKFYDDIIGQTPAQN